MPFWRRRQSAEEGTGLRLIVGLGNPGARYERTRHNVGFMVVNELARRAGIRFSASKHRAEIARGQLAGATVLLALPETFMNDSGNAVSRLKSYYRIPLLNLIVIADDLDLPFGTLRLRPSGSSGGQRGLQSIIESLGTDEFARVRIGVGRPRGSAVSHVLTPFPPEQERLLPSLLSVAADAVEATLREGVRAAMNGFNRDWLPELEAERT